MKPALFSMAAVNDRITRFVRDHDLPVIMFGFVTALGLVKPAVTHPLVHTYYFSGTDMPFAPIGFVEPASSSTLSNYLRWCQGDGRLGSAPVLRQPDDELCADPEIPVPKKRLRKWCAVMAGVFSQTQPVVVARRPRFTDDDLTPGAARVDTRSRLYRGQTDCCPAAGDRSRTGAVGS